MHGSLRLFASDDVIAKFFAYYFDLGAFIKVWASADDWISSAIDEAVA